MGKNKRKRSLNISSSSSKSGNVSLNISLPEEEKLDAKKKSDAQQPNHEISSTACETTSNSELTQNTENIAETENTRESRAGNHTSESVEDVGNFIYNSCDNLHSENIALGKCDVFESYYESMARRRSQSLENRPDWVIDSVSENKFVRTDFLREVPPQKNQVQFPATSFMEGKCHPRAHPRKRFKMSTYTNPVFNGFHDLNKDERVNVNDRMHAENTVNNSNSGSNIISNVVATNGVITNVVATNAVATNAVVANTADANVVATNVVATVAVTANVVFLNAADANVDPANVVAKNAVVTGVVLANSDDANFVTTNVVATNAVDTNFVPFTDPDDGLMNDGREADLDAVGIQFNCNQRMDLIDGNEGGVGNNIDRNPIADVITDGTTNTGTIVVSDSCDGYNSDVSVVQTTSVKSTHNHTQIRNTTKYKTIVVENSSYKTIPSTSRTNHLDRNKAISLAKQKTIEEMMNRTIYLKSGRRELIHFFKSKPYQLKKEITQMVGDEVERIQLAGDGLRILTRSINQRNKLLNLTELGGTPVTASLPFALTKKKEVKANPALKAVIYGLKENQDNLDHIASSLGLKSLKPLGNPQTSNTTLITFTDESEIPPHIIINGRFFKTWPFVPRPRRCNNCQAFDHSTLFCKNPIICSKCSGSHNFLDCPNMNSPKCANCSQPHSAAYKQCTKYLEVQQILKEKASQKPLFSDVLKRGLKPLDVEFADQNTVQMSRINPEIDASKSFSQVNVPHYEDQIVNNFLDFNRDDYRAVVKSEPLIRSENQNIPVDKAITFVQGVIALLDKDITVPEMRSILMKSANQFLFKGRVSVAFTCKNQ